MRLKLRAWDIREKRMYSPEEYDDVFSYLHNVCLSDWLYSENYIVMQSTELYDATQFHDLTLEDQESWFASGKAKEDWKGIEIFSGDILKSPGMSKPEIIEMDNDMQMWTFQRNQDESIYEKDKLLVIGNIHKNPELLEKIDG